MVKLSTHAGFPNALGIAAQSIAEGLKNDTEYNVTRLILEIDNVAVGEMSCHNKGG